MAVIGTDLFGSKVARLDARGYELPFNTFLYTHPKEGAADASDATNKREEFKEALDDFAVVDFHRDISIHDILDMYDSTHGLPPYIAATEQKP